MLQNRPSSLAVNGELRRVESERKIGQKKLVRKHPKIVSRPTALFFPVGRKIASQTRAIFTQEKFALIGSPRALKIGKIETKNQKEFTSVEI